MLTDKEKERFMSREEAKMRKWGNRQRNIEELITSTKLLFIMADSANEKIYFQKIEAILLMLKENADRHYEKWYNRMKENRL